MEDIYILLPPLLPVTFDAYSLERIVNVLLSNASSTTWLLNDWSWLSGKFEFKWFNGIPYIFLCSIIILLDASDIVAEPMFVLISTFIK